MSNRLTRLYELLACPTCRAGVRPQRGGLECAGCGRRYPIVDGVPVLLPDGAEPLPFDRALPLRHGYDQWIHRTILESLPADAVSLEIGAGNMAASLPNVIRVDVTLTPHVDVVGDTHALPLRDGAVDYVFSLAVMEHLRQPFAAAAEMHRVLRDGGYLYAECAFVFPFHGHPHHYFNASHLGLAELFRDFTALRSGVGPHQMPSFAVRALLETYRFFLSPHADTDATRLKARIGALLDEDLASFDLRFSQDAASRVAACTYFCGIKAPQRSVVMPAALLQAHAASADLQHRFPAPLDLTLPDNLLTWARDAGASTDPAVAAWRDTVVPFRKHEPVATAPPAATPRRGPTGDRVVRGLRAVRARVGGALGNGAPRQWRLEDIIDDGERVTHLFPNDCYVAHRSIYHFALPLVAGAQVLDAGCGAGYGAAYLADGGARAVFAIDASPKAVAFSRDHFVRPNLHYEARQLNALDGIASRPWDVVMCSNVLEHVADVAGFLGQVADGLHRDGTLIVAVPPIISQTLREQNLANPYHLNIWTPRQWAHVLGRWFGEVQAYQHWYEKPGVELNLINSPADTVVTEADFVFPAVTVDALYEVPTITAIFTARRPLPARLRPARGAPLTFVDDSFSRSGPVAERWPWRALRTLRRA